MPQPIDMQTELGRMAMTERMQHAAARASLAVAQRAQVEEDETRRLRETQVNETPETQSEHVDEDGRRKNPFVRRRRRRASSRDETATVKRLIGGHRKAPGSEDEHHFDVSV